MGCIFKTAPAADYGICATMIGVPVRLRKGGDFLVRGLTQIVGQDIPHSAMSIEENNVVSGMDLRFSLRLNGHTSVSLRLNGHPSGPFNQDVSNSCSVGRTPTYFIARNEPSATRMGMVKYYTLSITSVCEISRPSAASAATRRGHTCSSQVNT